MFESYTLQILLFVAPFLLLWKHVVGTYRKLAFSEYVAPTRISRDTLDAHRCGAFAAEQVQLMSTIDFEPAGFFENEGMITGVFRNYEEGASIFVHKVSWIVFRGQRRDIQKPPYYSLSTDLQSGHTVTTGAYAAGLVLPPFRTEFLQAFPGLALEPLLKHHKAAVTYVCGLIHTQPRKTFEEFEEESREMASQLREHTQGLSVLFLRVPYGLLWRRFRFANISIEQQHKRGWIKIPPT